MVLLVGEIGGESNRIALFSHKFIHEEEGGTKGRIGVDEMLVCQSFISSDYSEHRNNGTEILQQCIKKFLDENYSNRGLEPIYGACFSIAGPIDSDGTARIDRDKFKATFTAKDLNVNLPFKTVPISLLNDMEAIGYSIFLGDGEKQLESLFHDEFKPSPSDRRALMLVSAGLGHALWQWDERKRSLRPTPSEGGHGDFADPTHDKKLSIYLETIKRENGDESPISYEYILSSNGLLRIYDFLASTGSYNEYVLDLTSLVKNQVAEENKKELAQIIIEKATQLNPMPICKDALDLFISVWGAEAGNLALRFTASGGVYIGGSLPIPLEKLKDGSLRQSFINKEGKFKKDNSRIPVKRYNDPDIALWGAVRYALEEGFVVKGKFAIAMLEQQ